LDAIEPRIGAAVWTQAGLAPESVRREQVAAAVARLLLVAILIAEQHRVDRGEWDRDGNCQRRAL
jgi:hypothetical protein